LENNINSNAPENDSTSGVNFILSPGPHDAENADTQAESGAQQGAEESAPSEAQEQSGSARPYMQPEANYKKRKRLRINGRWPKAAAVFLLCLVLMAGSGVSGALIAQKLSSGSSSDKTVMYASVVREVSSENKADDALTTEQVVDLVADSVVEITTEVTVTGSRMTQYISEGAGSGVVVSSDGYIVTNAHVVEDAGKITVTLKDGTEYEATLVGSDSQTDIAVLKIDADDLTPVIFGDSADLVVGDTAIVIGNPLGQLGGTVTVGIISALDRQITIDDEVMTLLQTDAAVNPGNSGGGLFNIYGELVGIVNAKSSGEDVEGLGFAIPVDLVKTAISDIIEYGYVTGRADVGLTFIDISDSFTAMSYRVSEYGVYILNVEEGSNAENAGLSAGLIVTAVNGQDISSVSEINAAIEKLNIGDTLSITVKNGSKTKTYDYVLAEDKG
jgi:serine protease Do